MRSDYQKAVDNNFNVQHTQGIEINALERKRLDGNYTCKDINWHTGTYRGDVYISTPNDTHSEILKHHADPEYKIPENGYPGTSGFFTNEDTASKYFSGDSAFDSVGLGHDLQQAPYYDKDRADITESLGQNYNPEYNNNLDCFRVNSEKMFENYGTTDFYAAQSRCMENTAWGEGGGFQGYNPHINEMINNGSLEYVPEKSRSCANNECLDYSSRKAQAGQEASAVSEHIEKNNIKGEPGERIGYNELSHTNTKQDSPVIRNDNARSVSSDNVESIGGGGARAPDNTRGNTDNPPIDKDSSKEYGTKPSQEDTPPSNKGTSSERGQRPSSTEGETQSNGAERGQKPAEGENKSQGNNPTPRGEMPQEAPQSNSNNGTQTQRRTPPDSSSGEDSKTPTHSNNQNDSFDADSSSSKAADEASKAASEQSAQNVAPKATGMGV